MENSFKLYMQTLQRTSEDKFSFENIDFDKAKLSSSKFKKKSSIDFMDFKYDCQVFEKGSSIYIKYDELNEGVLIKNTVKISDECVQILKSVDKKIIHKMNFEKEKQTVSKYNTGQGVFFINMFTKKIDILTQNNLECEKKKFEVDVINLEIKYDLEIEGMFNGENWIKIRVVK